MDFYVEKPYETVYYSKHSHFKCLNAWLEGIFKDEPVLCPLTSKVSASGCMIMKEEVHIPKEIFEVSRSQSVSTEFKFYTLHRVQCAQLTVW